MKHIKKLLALCLTLALVLSLAACGKQEEQPPETTPASYRIAALKGPTAMGLVKLMQDAAGGTVESGNTYDFTLAGSADEVTPALIKGELDMACVPANLAAVLYGKTEGAVEVLAVNTLGVLYIVENGSAVQSITDLKGQTIVAAGKGSTPEYALRYLLSENGIDPDNDVTIDWKNEHSECVAALASNQATIALLPQPFVTVAQSKIDGLRMALDLTAEWDKLGSGSTLITGVIVARREVVEQNPAAVGPDGGTLRLGRFFFLDRGEADGVAAGGRLSRLLLPFRLRGGDRETDGLVGDRLRRRGHVTLRPAAELVHDLLKRVFRLLLLRRRLVQLYFVLRTPGWFHSVLHVL